jgi:hypothetical protein
MNNQQLLQREPVYVESWCREKCIGKEKSRDRWQKENKAIRTCIIDGSSIGSMLLAMLLAIILLDPEVWTCVFFSANF